jgi:TfoX/Sxy family transcriptional regulator of competence genes
LAALGQQRRAGSCADRQEASGAHSVAGKTFGERIDLAYDEKLVQRVRSRLAIQKGFSEKKMFGGIAFMLEGRMCCGVLGDRLVARIGLRDYDEALAQPHVRAMDFTGRPMKGYVYVEPTALRSARSLESWLQRCVAFVATLPAKKPNRD